MNPKEPSTCNARRAVLVVLAAAVLQAGVPLLQAEGARKALAVVEENETGDAPADQDNGIRYEGDRLTASVTGMGLHAMLKEIGRQSGARVRIEGVADRTVAETFTRLPLHEALRRVLGENENFALTYVEAEHSDGGSGESRLKELRVYGDGGATITAAPSQPGDALAAETNARPSGSLMEEFSRLLDRHSELQLRPGSPLAAAMGGERVAFQDVVTVAIGNDDPALRTEAADVLARVLDSDAGARALLSAGQPSGMDAGAMAAVLHASGGAHTEEFLGHMAKSLKTPALRVRANQVLGRLRQLP